MYQISLLAHRCATPHPRVDAKNGRATAPPCTVHLIPLAEDILAMPDRDINANLSVRCCVICNLEGCRTYSRRRLESLVMPFPVWLFHRQAS